MLVNSETDHLDDQNILEQLGGESSLLSHSVEMANEEVVARQQIIDKIERITQENLVLSTMLSNLPGMAYRCRKDWHLTMEFVSDGCFVLTGYLPKDLIQNKIIAFGQLIHVEDRQTSWLSIESAVQEHKSYDLVYRISTMSGQEKWVRDIGRGVFNPQGGLVALEGFITDITDRKQSDRWIQSQVQKFEALRKIDIAITASFDLRVTLDILLDQVINLLNVDASDVLLLNPYTQTLEYTTGRGFRTTALQHTRLRLGEGLAGKAAMQRKTIHIADREQLLHELKRALNIGNEDFATYYGMPLMAKGQVKGILEVFHRTPLEPDAEWMNFLEALAGQAAIAVDNATLFEDLQRSNIELTMTYDATLEGWSKALELRDQETEGHAQRVTEMAVRLAQAMGVNAVELLHIRRGALLHDIGKMGIPDSILLKPGPLSEEEWEIMRQHPIYAHQLLSTITNLRPALEIPFCHHEKWDGTGYPRGLRGEQIPLAGRIFAVVDVWDALISDRPYRKAWPRDRVLEYIQIQAGKHFDPQVVEAFLGIVDASPGSSRIVL